ncbi:MAG: ABC transporter permease, partial [Eubacteriales bacterium]|nr:ABC transporter permease [Eubacteriales bacterium]
MQSKQLSTNRMTPKKFLDQYSIMLITVLMIVIATILQGTTFLSLSNFVNIVRNNSVVGIIAFGMSLVIISGNIDLSVGAQMVLVASLTLDVVNRTGSAFLGVLTAFAFSCTLSLITGLIVTKGRVPSFIVTLGLQYIYRSILIYT